MRSSSVSRTVRALTRFASSPGEIVTPACANVGGKKVSRIVPMLAQGSVVTVPRTFVHYVVTEYGIAHLTGKSIRDRARELIAVAHPDFRSELAADAKRIWG